MSESLTIYRLLKKDPRFPIEAYQFVREGLSFATEVLKLGKRNSPALPKHDPPTDLELSSSEFQMQIDQLADNTPADLGVSDELDPIQDDLDPIQDELDEFLDELEAEEQAELAAQQEAGGAKYEGQHLTGQELCDALRLYALQQYGYMAKSVLDQWGIHSTSDFGSIVYNMIEIGLMRKSKEDRREHFDNVYDFQEVFIDQFRFTSPV